MSDMRDKIDSLPYPGLEKTLGQLHLIESIEGNGDDLKVTITIPSPAIDSQDKIKASILELAPQAEVNFNIYQAATPRGLGSSLLADAKNIIAVASGKGGVGKSTIACNLGAALSSLGCKVAILDADIYGPSQPHLLGAVGSQVKVKAKRILPVEAHGMKLMSMGFLMKPGDSVIWRGPMLHGMMQQFCRDVEWEETDFLIIDLPPGTGDISLSLSQIIDVSGSVVVSTPQDLALDVATKAVGMFNKLGIPILGLVENMSYYSCPHCNERDDIFHHGGTADASKALNLPVLGEIPLNSALRRAGDAGVPLVLKEPESAPAQALIKLARQVAEMVSLSAHEADKQMAAAT